VTGDDLARAIATWLGNRRVFELDYPAFVWEHGRTLGRRYALGPPGKEFLL
jgi:hypothetical protein